MAKKYTDAWCRHQIARARRDVGRRAIMTRGGWCAFFDCSDYGIDQLREYGERSGAPFVPVRFEGLMLGNAGDEAELVSTRAQEAMERIAKAETKYDNMRNLRHYPNKIAPRLADLAGGDVFRLLGDTVSRLTQRLLPS